MESMIIASNSAEVSTVASVASNSVNEVGESVGAVQNSTEDMTTTDTAATEKSEGDNSADETANTEGADIGATEAEGMDTDGTDEISTEAMDEEVSGEQVSEGDAAAVEETMEGEDIMIDNEALDSASLNMGYDEGMMGSETMLMDSGMTAPKDPLLSSWPFVIGISAAVLIVSIALGLLLARRKIKKGIELYED